MSNTQPGWKSKTSLFEKKYVTRQIGEAEWRFYPVSVARLFQLRETIKNICTSASFLFGGSKDDCGQEIEKITSNEGVIERNNIAAIQPDLAALRDRQRREGIAASIDALLGDANKLAIGRLLADSLREEFDRNPKDTEIQEFLDTLDLAQLVEMLMGFAEANAKVFGPLGEKMRVALKAKLGELASAVQPNVAEGGAPAPSTPAS